MKPNKTLKAVSELTDLLPGLMPETDPGVSPAIERLVQAASDIALAPATADDAVFLHAVLCQVGMPRKKTTGTSFERTDRGVSLLLTAGKLWNGSSWIQQELPYGPKPRLMLINLTSAAITTNNRFVDVGRSTREFLKRMGLSPQGSEYRALRRQVAALSACRMQLGARIGQTVVNLDTQPIHRFDVWIGADEQQQTLWPGVVELSQEYFDGVKEHAVPLDERAVAALRGSALALDVYTWLAHRLWRVRETGGAVLPWSTVKVQFGQEYREDFNFRHEFRRALRQVMAVYPDAKVSEGDRGLVLRRSSPPIPRVLVHGR